MYDAQFTGELFDLPAGPVKMAAGVEYREESISDIPDDQFQRGLIFGTEAVSAAAGRDIKALYVEFSVPILEGLELSLAGRYDDYSDFGDTTNPKVAVRWAPIDTLALRASWGTGFRAPSLAQIGLGPSEESQFFVDTYGCAAGVVGACTALDYNIVFSGNPDLDAEESETLNLGVAFKPTEDIEVTLDYWDIAQENKIDEVPFGFIYDRILRNADQRRLPTRSADRRRVTRHADQRQFGFHQHRRAVGQRNRPRRLLWHSTVGPGQLTFGLAYSHLLKFERIELDSTGENFVTRSLEGEYEYPEDKATVTADFGTENFGVYASVNYIGAVRRHP